MQRSTVFSRRFPTWLAVVLAAGLLAAAIGARGAGAGQEEQDQQAEGARAAEIQPGELLIISIDGLIAPGFETRLVRRVGRDGELWLPLLDDQPVSSKGLTAGQLQAEIRRALMRRGSRVEIVAVARADMGEDQQFVVPQVEEPRDQQRMRR